MGETLHSHCSCLPGQELFKLVDLYSGYSLEMAGCLVMTLVREGLHGHFLGLSIQRSLNLKSHSRDGLKMADHWAVILEEDIPHGHC